MIRAFVIENDADSHSARITTVEEADLGDGNVVVAVEFSSVNYKDALAAEPGGNVARISPLIGGIDLAGTVAVSTDDRFDPGDRVLATGHDLGVAHHGGYAQNARVPGDWLHRIPETLSTEEVMQLGTAGLTAALCVQRLEAAGLHPGSGPVLVTGASGGVGSCAVSMLSRRGFTVVASSGKADRFEWLRRLGAAEIVPREELGSERPRALGAQTWAGAVDTVGGSTLANVLPRISYGGCIAACGNAGGGELTTTVFPFILRGVSLLGVDSVAVDRNMRASTWARLAGDLRPDLAAIAATIPFDDLPRALAEISRGEAVGRTAVAIEP